MALDADFIEGETAARPAAARSPAPDKAALKYIEASGATAIQIIENVKGCAFKVGTKIDARAAEIFWLRETEAQAVLKAARKHAGRSPDIATATAALHRAAADQRAVLTPHATAMTRAGEAAKRLDGYIEQLRARGALRIFMKEFRRRRLAAQLRNEGFMSFKNAELRLRRAVGGYLSGGRDIQTATLFRDVFGG